MQPTKNMISYMHISNPNKNLYVIISCYNYLNLLLLENRMRFYCKSSNPNVYDTESAFSKLKQIDWKIPIEGMKSNDILFIYENKRTHIKGCISYIAQIINPLILPEQLLNNDLNYYIKEQKIEKKYFRIKPIKILADEYASKLKLEILRSINITQEGTHGFSTPPNFEITPPLLDYILEVLKPLQIKEFEGTTKEMEKNIKEYDTKKLDAMISNYAKELPNRLKKTDKSYWNALLYYHENKVPIDNKNFPNIFTTALKMTPNGAEKITKLVELFEKYYDNAIPIFKELLSDSFNYQSDFESIKSKLAKYTSQIKDNKNTLEQTRNITAYLWLEHPSLYYIYYYGQLTKTCEDLKIKVPSENTSDKVKLDFLKNTYDSIKQELINNKRIKNEISLHNNIISIDPNYNALVMDFMQFYFDNLSNKKLSSSKENSYDEENNNLLIEENISIPITNNREPFKQGGKNIIVYGAPGVGKSWHVNKAVEGKYNNRVIFHNEYTYFDFVGAYKPVPVFKKTNDIFFDAAGSPAILPGNPYINYEFVPGPFIDTLIHAYQNPQDMHYLVIEELNRANAAAVFGDIFQLLDRDNDGKSEYSIKISRELYNYLSSKDINLKNVAQDFRIPSNMTIYATMNSADQGVNYMDSAFKRRWEYEYIPIIEKQIPDHLEIEYAGNTYKYRTFLSKLNELLKDRKIDEDRLIGPWFLKENEEATTISYGNIQKLNLYLWDDIFRHNRKDIFKNVSTLHELNDKFAKEDVLGIKEKLPTSQNGEEQ